MARRFTFLGTGTSVGVPCLGCDCEVCRSTDPRNHRNRPAAMVTTAAGQNILIDTPPELRLELLAVGNPIIHAVLYTHYHADHMFGIDDLRAYPRHLGGPVPVYCADDVEASIRTSFGYIFPSGSHPSTDYLPKLEFHRIKPGELVYVLGERILPIELVHAQFRVLGFRIGNLAYCTDVNRIPEIGQQKLEGLDVLVIDALRYRPHPAHLSLNESLELIAKLKPKRAFLTHMSHELDHATVEKDLPDHVRMGYDGLSFEF
ncbi:MAG: MBL fold metallo-hydrolase [Gemmataceae bacterium]|nr:MBL fold metallo-hydrolase [Gemmataceae bacterium]